MVISIVVIYALAFIVWRATRGGGVVEYKVDEIKE